MSPKVCVFSHRREWLYKLIYQNTCLDTLPEYVCPPPAKSCGNAGEILYGSYDYTGTQFGDTVKAVCDHG